MTGSLLPRRGGSAAWAAAVATFTVIGGALSAGCGPQVIDAVGRDPCVDDPTLLACTPVVWPNQRSASNSDPWLVTHHDQISEMHPRVLVLHFHNRSTAAHTATVARRLIEAMALGSRYHGYSDPTAPAFLQYELAGVIDLSDDPIPTGWPHFSSTLLPTDADGAFDHLPLFDQQWADRYGFADPVDPSRNLTLCELFERGLVNEVWLAVGEPANTVREPPLMAERKQVYDTANNAIPGLFEPLAGGAPLAGIDCRVSVRMAHLSPVRLTDCDLQTRGFGLQSMRRALPYLAVDGAAFMNSDFQARFNTRFNGWTQICDLSGNQCVAYRSPSIATGFYSDGTQWTIPSFVQGCGTAQFPANARARWDFNNSAPVQSRCEHFGMRDAPGGSDDLLDQYTAAKGAAYTASIGGYDCGGGWAIYWRQSMPGYGNRAFAHDGRRMKNWWPFLFY